MKKHSWIQQGFVVLLAALAACGDGTGGSGSGAGSSSSSASSSGNAACALNTYDGSTHSMNAAAQLDAKKRYLDVAASMKAAELDLNVKPKASELTMQWQAGTPSLESLTTAYYQGVVAKIFTAFENAAGNMWMPSSMPMGSGGQYGEFIFTAEGIDLRQAYEKGLFQSLFYYQAYQLAQKPMDQKSLDQLLALYGAHPSFPGSSDTSDPVANPNPDKLAAQYAERRSPKDPADASKPLDPEKPGPYFRVKEQFIRAQLALSNPACGFDADAAAQEILKEWERVMAATVIFYLNEAAEGLGAATTPAETAEFLHAYGEASAFVHGFKQLPAEARTLSDQKIDELLTLLFQPPEGEVTAYRLVTDAAAEIPKLVSAISAIADVYGFSAEEIESFKVAH